MPHSTWILFAVVAAALLVVPGRSKRMVLSYALAHGRKSVFATGTGVALGTAVSVAATLAISWGLIALSTLTFSIFQWVGLFWLMLFGLGLARAPAGIEPVADNDNLPEEKPLRVIAHCFESESRDPRSSLLVAALLPQFLTPDAPFIPQAIAFGATFVALSALSCIVYALFPERVRKIVRKHAVRRTVNRSGRTVLIAAKAVTAGYRKIAA
ncbi:LysE family translocator [Agrobacterium sp. RAC06]|uniref:LysE family translocator n=1 Tax=Agrobacterium sp. RAC06 TaxID=1842536 RepID=UPI00083DC09B|nr:LysE family translocator [Agrobacterium sp. RAC06]AOG09009.1 lysE type translocator family protein [Agrobacterium sp. RAC06]